MIGRRTALLGLLTIAAAARGAETPVTAFPAPVDAAPWGELLTKYVDTRGLVAYGRWKSDAADRGKLSRFLARLGAPASPSLSEDEKVATLINAYNAFIVAEVLERYPVDGIRSIPGAFTEKTHRLGGILHSLDEIEHTAVRLGGYRVHAALVCASRSCPPLDRRPFAAPDLSAHEDERMRAWMARSDLYRFDPARNAVFLPRYFDWYHADFEKAGVANVLSTYAPREFREWLSHGRFRVEFLDYDWSLNDRDRPAGAGRAE